MLVVDGCMINQIRMKINRLKIVLVVFWLK